MPSAPQAFPNCLHPCQSGKFYSINVSINNNENESCDVYIIYVILLKT